MTDSYSFAPHHERHDAVDFKVREEESIEIGRRPGDKDDFKRQSAEMRGVFKEKPTLKEQIVSGELSSKIQTAAEPYIERAKEVVEQGKQKIEQWKAEPTSKETKVYASEQPGSIPQANILGLPSPAPVDTESSIRPVHHTSAGDFAFSSIPDSTSLPIARVHDKVIEEETQPLLDKQPSSSGLGMTFSSRATSGDPIPSAYDTPETVGMDAGEGLEYIKSRMEPQIAKAKSLYQMWKNEDKRVAEEGDRSAVSSGGEPSMMQKAQQIYTENVLPAATAAKEKVAAVYHSSVEPTLTSTVSAVQEQAGLVRQDGFKKTVDRASAAYQRRTAPKVANAKASVKTTYKARVPAAQRQQLKKGWVETKDGILKTVTLLKNKAMDIWEGEEPIIRAKVQQGVALANKYNMSLPLLFLGTLLVLWASISFIGWMAFPSTTQVNNQHLPVLYEPAFKPSTGPIQGPAEPGLTDKIKMQVNGFDTQLRDGVADLRDSGAQQLRDLKDRAAETLPSVDDIKDRAGDLKDRVLERMPSMDHVTEGLRKQAAAATAAIPSMEEIKARAADGLESARTSLKYPDVAQTHTQTNIPVHIHTAAPVHITAAPAQTAPSATSDIGLKIKDRLHHVADAVIPDVSNLKQRVVNLKDQVVRGLTPEQRQAHFAATGEVLDPENHVVEEMDSHKHVKESIQL